jgi:hypothetical protein
MPENHGVPGSNPGPATFECPANSEKIKGLGIAAGAPLSTARLRERLLKRVCGSVLHTVCGAVADGKGHPDIEVA